MSESTQRTPLSIVLPHHQFAHFSVPEVLISLRQITQISSLILVPHESQDPEDKGHISIQDPEFDRVMRCFSFLVDEITLVDPRSPVQIVMQIDERFIPHVHGSDIKLIEKISSISKASMQLLKASTTPGFMKLSILGEQTNINQAVREVYQSMVSLRTELRPIASAKLIIPNSCINEIAGHKDSYFQTLSDSQNVEAEVYMTRQAPCTKTESILVRFIQALSGTLPDIRSSFGAIIKRVSEKISEIDTNNEMRDQTRLVIATNMISTLIGRAGCNIKELHRKCPGAIIRVVTEKNMKGDRFIEVNIRGEVEARIEASILVTEHLSESSSSAPPFDRREQRAPVRRSRSRSHSKSVRYETSICMLVPNAFVKRLIGRSGENVNSMGQQSRARISFLQKSENKLQAADGSMATLCSVEGSAKEIATAVKLILEQVQEHEKRNLTDSPS